MHWKRESGLALLALTAGSGVLLAQNNPCHTTQAVSTIGSAPVAQAAIVYDPTQSVCWLANANLAGDPTTRAALGVSGVNPNGSMDYDTALRWIAALNAYNSGAGYLGHNNWQLPVAALVDKTCPDVGTNGGSFGPQCTGSALGNLYSVGLKQTYPASVAPGLSGTVPPIRNLKSSYYWAAQNNGGTSGTHNGGQEMFSFANGIQGGTTINDTYYYTFPMVPGPIGTAPSCPSGASVVAYTSGPASGSAVYDCITGYTWPVDANLAESSAFGITGNNTLTYPSRTITAPVISGGAMLYQTATQWVQAMNNNKYLGSTAWQIPAAANILQDLFNDLKIASGDTRLQWNGTLGPFQNLQPFFYWACGRDQSGSSQSPCITYAPADGTAQLQWSYDFDYGFQSTSSLIQPFFVTAYYPVTSSTGPVVSLVANAEGEALEIAPNSWVEIKGLDLAPAGQSRIWQSSDFTGNQMPTQINGVSVMVNGKNAFVYYVSPTQVNILTPPGALPMSTPIVVTNNGASAAASTALGQSLSPSFFVLSDGQHLAAIHLDGSLIGPASFSVPGYTFTPAQPGETISLYANGFGPTSITVVSGSVTQGGVLSPMPVVTIGGKSATVLYAGLVSPGLFQFNVVVPSPVANGDLTITASYNGSTTQAGTVLSVSK
jgi:uncharacterized protein (TIGR03437 family)